MKNLIIIIIIAAAYMFYNKSSSSSVCTSASDVKAKEVELFQVMAGGAEHNNIDRRKLMGLMVQIDSMKKKGYPNPQVACDAYDSLMDEF